MMLETMPCMDRTALENVLCSSCLSPAPNLEISEFNSNWGASSQSIRLIVKFFFFERKSDDARIDSELEDMIPGDRLG